MMFRRSMLATLALPALVACGTTVQPGQLALKNIVLDEPALQSEVLPEGFYWQWPWNSMIAYDVTWQSQAEEIEILTEDDLHVPTTVSVTFRPDHARLHELHTRIGISYYDDVIRPPFMTTVRGEFARYKHNDLARMGPEIEDAVLKRLRTLLGDKPLQIDAVSIRHIRYDRDVTRSISTKLVKEQQAEQKRYELEIAKQDAEIARTAARGFSDSTRIKSEGKAAAIVVTGRAQAVAQKAITETLTKAYLQYKAFDNASTSFYFVPIGKDGLPLIINAEPHSRRVAMKR